MKALLVRIEPIIWLLFGQGILIGTILLTAWLLVIGVLIPLGVVSPDALAYEREYRLATAAPFGLPIGRLLLVAIMALPLWKGAHHLRSLALDFGGFERDAVVGSALYATAAVGSIMAVLAVFRL